MIQSVSLSSDISKVVLIFLQASVGDPVFFPSLELPGGRNTVLTLRSSLNYEIITLVNQTRQCFV